MTKTKKFVTRVLPIIAVLAVMITSLVLLTACNDDPVLVAYDTSKLALYSYRVGYIQGDADNNTVDLTKALPESSNFSIADTSLATISGNTLTANKPGKTTMTYTTKDVTTDETVTRTIDFTVLDGYTNVDTWDELYSAVRVEGATANVCVQAELTATAGKNFLFVDYTTPDYAGEDPSPQTLNLYGNMLKWDTSAITTTGTTLFQIDWCDKTINITDVHMAGDTAETDENNSIDLSQFEGNGAFFSAMGSKDVRPTFNITHCLTENTQKHISVRATEVNIDGCVIRNGADALVAAETYPGYPGAEININNSVLANSVVCGVILWSSAKAGNVQNNGDYCTVNLTGFVDFYTWKNRTNTKLMPGNDPSGSFVVDTVNTMVGQEIGKSKFDKFFVYTSPDADKSGQYINLAMIRLSSGDVDPNASTINGYEELGLMMPTEDILPGLAYSIIKNCDLYALDPENADLESNTWINPLATMANNPNINDELVYGRD